MTPERDIPIGRPVPRCDSFEVIELDGPPLTDEEKSWPMVAAQARLDSFEILEDNAAVPETNGHPDPEGYSSENALTLELTLYLTDNLPPDSLLISRDLNMLIDAVNAIDCAAGGHGYHLGRRIDGFGRVGLTLLPLSMEGAKSRIQFLVNKVTSEGLAVPGVERITVSAA